MTFLIFFDAVDHFCCQYSYDARLFLIKYRFLGLESVFVDPFGKEFHFIQKKTIHEMHAK